MKIGMQGLLSMLIPNMPGTKTSVEWFPLKKGKNQDGCHKNIFNQLLNFEMSNGHFYNKWITEALDYREGVKLKST